ncbi:MAG: undecaprenyldiphospho-muramoylpentapeptide beta-N-acetylglucosaminyltransferase [Cardiobacteriaceae bacterium]|nr:undecaprenyldiphospho-muramoylpentapeptide beta-N-acetylglucosaminyltransferase [Cardiobacteriaceae bacterium]
MSTLQGKTVLMMAGGTGGHVYPALAVARAAQERGATIHWLGNAHGFEGRKVPEAGFAFHDIAVRGLRGNGLLGWLKAPFMLWRALRRAGVVIRDTRPDVVIGMGGFASGPGGLVAAKRGIPLVIHEQNAVAGLTNRRLARHARKILLADARAAVKMGLKAGEYVVTGNPVRLDISAVPAPAQRFLGRLGAMHLLVLGGSQGAKALNTLLPQALALLKPEMRPQVLHQVGERWLEEAQSAYQQAGVTAEIVPFIEDMAGAYGAADWLIARSGALTVAEVSTVGVSALFVPFPFAVDDHQTANAQGLVEAKAATLIQQADLTAEKLAEEIVARHDRGLLLMQADRARSCSHAKALENIMQEIEAVL